jgi:hypothetical protein
MRGSETAQYVDNIMQRHSQYRVALATGAKVKVPVNVPVPVNLVGQQVGAGYKGIVISNGKKVLR